VSALFEAFFAAELLLSGRLVPMTLLPEWAQTLANFLPFQWTFGFPITALVGPITDEELFVGLAAQAGWIVFGAVATWLIWRRAVRLYTAVSG
jgi:ABC-2 type transport system permease protein